MTLKRVFGILNDRVRVGPDHESNVPSTELGLYVGNGGTLLALTPEQVAFRNDGNGNGNGHSPKAEDKQPANPAQQELPSGYQQATD